MTCDHKLILVDKHIQLLVQDDLNTSQEKTLNWFTTKVLPKLKKWMEDDDKNFSKSETSLRLINLEEYNHLYSKFKEKYGKEFLKVTIYSQNRFSGIQYVLSKIHICTFSCLPAEHQAKHHLSPRKTKNTLIYQNLTSLGV